MIPLKMRMMLLKIYAAQNESFILIATAILFCFCISTSVFGQTNPNYQERTFLSAFDTLTKKTWQNFSETSVDPDEYMVGPGENFFISISGIEETNLNAVLNHENFLFIPKVGSINLKGLTLNQAREKIKLTLEKYYKKVDIFVTLGGLRKIKVYLVGDVKKPTSLIMDSNSKLLDLLVSSEGFNPSSSYRDIQIKDSYGEVRRYDFLKFLRFGDKRHNPLLKDGDVVFVDKVDKVVTISGPVKYPATYEFLEGETVSELITLAGGLLFNAKTDSIEIVRFDEKGKSQKSLYYSYEEIRKKNLPLFIKDHVIVRLIPDYFIDNLVKIDGWVKYPGVYKIKEDTTLLSEIILQAGGFKKDASIKDATLTRTTGEVEYDPELERLKLIPRADMTDDEYDYLKAKSRQRKGKVVVDFERLFVNNDRSEDIVLRRNDIINVPEAKNTVNVIGQVVNPGGIIYKQGLEVNDYIDLAGGFGWRALKRDVRVIKANTGEWIDDEDVESIEPGDVIWVPEDPPGPKFWEVFTTSLQVLGQIATVVAATVAVIVATR